LSIEVTVVRRIMILIRSPPHGSTNVGEGLRVAIALAGMDLETTIVLIDDAVLAALKGQVPDAIAATSLDESILNAKEFGAKLMVHEESLQQRAIGKDELLEVETIGTEKIAELAHEVDATVTF
jgi:sulfur relay (sulfurtransferase) DsrF/TusC family protein